MAEEEEDPVPLLTFPDGTDSWTIGQAWESLHQLKLWHMITTFLFSLAVWSSCLAFGVTDKITTGPGSTPFSHYHWWLLGVPTIGIFVFGLMLHAWAHNMIKAVRALLRVVAIIYLVLLIGWFVWAIIERWALCPSGPPFKVWCTSGAASPIDWEFDWFLWSILAQLFFLGIELWIFRQITKKVKLLLHPMTNLTHEQIVRELYSSHGPRYVQNIGISVQDIIDKNPNMTLKQRNAKFAP